MHTHDCISSLREKLRLLGRPEGYRRADLKVGPYSAAKAWNERRRQVRLFRLLRDVTRWQRGPLAEEEVLHLPRDQLLRFFLPRHQAVLVEDHLHSLFPQLPRLRRDVLVNPLTKFTGPGRRIEPGQIFLEFDAVHHPAAFVADGCCFLRSGSAFSHRAMVTYGVLVRLKPHTTYGVGSWDWGLVRWELGVDTPHNLNCRILRQTPAFPILINLT